MWQKQKPVFSTLEEIELDISSGEKLKGNFSSENKTLSGLFPEPTRVLPSATIAADPIPDPPQGFASRNLFTALRMLAADPPPGPPPDSPPDPPRTAGIHLSESSFVYIAPGSFLMGSPEYEPGRGSDETQHEVTLSSYTLQTTPVTQGQWKAVMGNNPSCFLQGGEDCPVEGISWIECQEFIKRLNENGEYLYRLPTEAEWEYACRAGTSASFFNGEITGLFCRCEPCLETIGWYCGNSDRKTHPVAGKNPSAWGLFDMHGNVYEWCQDWYGAFSALPQTDPTGATFGPGRVVRGGSWFSNSQNCRSASRYYRAPNSRSDFVGFRLVREQ
jgi:formylglycine-generating enzyme required for sulfatase activity